MITDIKRSVLFTLVTMVLFGGLYHALLLVIGSAVFPSQAEGSLIRRPDGTVVGSRLIAQPFARAEYFHPRPSGVDYNAAATGGTNYGPSNPDHLDAVRARVEAIRAAGETAAVPSETVTSSGAGLDPHIPPGGAEMQIARVAAARGIAPDRVREIVRTHTLNPTFGIFGRPRVNVLELNMALDAAFGARSK